MTRALPLVLLALGFLHVPLLHGQGAQSTAVEVEHAGFLAKRWTTEHGLPVNHITDLLAARNGYLWIATHDGLTRFDGHRFTVFNTGNSPALSSNRIDLLHETPDGTMWLRTESFAVARVRAGRLESVPDLPEVIGRSFRQDADTLWLTTAEGLYRHDARGLRRAFPELIDEPVTEVVRDGRGALWVVGAHTLYRIGGTPGEASVRRFTAADGLPSLADGRLVVSAESFSVLFDAGTPDQEALWVGGVRGLTRWDGTQFEAMYPDAPVWDEQKVLDIQQAADGTLSFGTSVYGWFTERAGQLVPFDAASRSLPGDESLRMLTDATGRVWRSQHDALYRDGERVLRLRQPGYRFRRAATIDAHGTLWIGANGLYQIRRREVQPLRIDADPTQNSVYPLLETRDGSIWLGAWAERGLARWTDGRLERYSPATDAPEASDFATALHEDDQGTLWIGTLNRLGYMQPGRPSGSRFQRLEAPIDATLLRRVSALHTDTEGVLWLGSEAGLARLQLRRAPLGGPEAETGITVEAAQAWAGLADVRMLTSTRDGHLLLGTMGRGLGRSVTTLSNVTATSSEDAFEWLTTTDGLPSNYVRDAYEEADGTLWIATQDRGLCRLDRSTHRSLVAAARAGGLRCLDVSDGLFDNSLHRVLDDGLGRLWLSSNRGLFWLDRAALDAYLAGTQAYLTSGSYTERDGMHSREANGARSPAGVRASDGRLWFPTQDGAVVIDPRTVAPLPPVPVRIESVEVRDSTWIPSSDPIVLPTGVHDVRIAYTSLAFERPETVRYRVRLDGYDDAWGPPTTERRAAYTNLPPGTYTLRIEASRGGAWSTPATLTLVRPPRFWETRVFAGLVLVVLGIAGMGLYRQRVRHLTRRQAALEATVEARTAEIRANEGRLAKQTARLSLQTTLLAEQAAALRQADATKSRFLANLTHEFRTPLTLTFGPLDDLLGDRYTSVDEARPVLRRARRHGQRLLRLINQLLDLARMDAEAVLLQPTHVDLASFVRQRVAAFGSGLDAHTLHLDLPADPLWHHCDTALLETALLNLLGNAVKFTPPGGHVSVRLRAETNGAGESVAVLAVQDTGPGIEPKHQPFVFERFYQVDASDTRAHEGSGIGLALVQEVVRLHGGSVAVESEVGAGATFTLRLPSVPTPVDSRSGDGAPWALPVLDAAYSSDDLSTVARPSDDLPTDTAPQSTDLSPADGPAAVPPASERPLLLIVEDSADLRLYLRSHLDAAYEVLEAADGAEGLRLAREHVPDLVLSDVMMPVLDGFALLAALKADARTSHVPVVLLTARADAESRLLGLGDGADDYIAKPFDMGALLARMANLIAQRRALRARWQTPSAQTAAFPSEVPPLPEASDLDPVPAQAATDAASLEVDLPPREAVFLHRVEVVVAERMTEVTFGADALAVAMGMSTRQLRRKLLSLRDETPAALILRVRLVEGARQLRDGARVNEAARGVGIPSTSTFRKAFVRQYGLTPSAYAKAPSDQTSPPGTRID